MLRLAAPDLLGNLLDECKLGPLLVFGELVAYLTRGKPTDLHLGGADIALMPVREMALTRT